jgi:cell volume regulation protein A
MLPFEYILLVVSVLVLISVMLSRLSENLGMPSLLLFLIIGMLAGSDGLGKIQLDDFFIAQHIGMLALVFILFSGGLETKWKDVQPILWHAVSLSTIGVLVTTAAIGFFIHYVFHLKLIEGFLIGAIISSTDAAAVFSVLRGSGTILKGNMRPVLELESGTNDPTAIMLTIILIEMIRVDEFSVLKTILFLVMQIGLGGIVGYTSGYFMALSMNRLKFPYPSLYPVFIIAGSIFVYAVTASIGGSGILAVYVSAVVLGNSEFIQKKSLIRFFDGLAFLGQIIMFLTLGLLVYPSQLYNVIGAGLITSACLIFFARPVGVFISLMFSKFKLNEKSFVSWVGLRGAVPIILATFPLTAGLEIGQYVFNLVFFITLTSALVQGWSVPLAARIFRVKAKQVFEPEAPIEMTDRVSTNNELLDLVIHENSFVIGKTLAELRLPPESLITVVYRDNDYVVPSGGTSLEAGDTILILVNKSNIETVKSIFTIIK